MRIQAGAVAEQMADEDPVVARRAGEFRKVADDGSVEVELSAVVENFGGGSGGDYFGQRREVEHGVARHVGGVRGVIHRTEGFEREQLSVAANGEDRTGKGAEPDPFRYF